MPDSHPLVCRFGAFGDMVLLTPLLRQLYLRSGLPCDVVATGGWSRILFREMPYVREVYSIDSRSAPYWFNRSQRELVRQLKHKQHRFVWVCETSRKSYRLLERAGITRDNSINQLDLSPVEGEHYGEKWLRMGSLNPPEFDCPQAPAQALDSELFVSERELLECRDWIQARALDPAAPIICIQAGSKRTTRRGRSDRSSNSKYWHEGNWAELIDRLIEHLPGAQVLLCGVPAESDTCAAVQDLCRHSQQVHNVAKDLPMRRLLALLSRAHSCISVDTGPAHAAAALDCPLVVLFGKANPARFRPISSHSPVKVVQGYTGANPDSEPDIDYISADQVFEQWIAATDREG
ncbi:MAG: glycosyltransferase family 9 protein [Gammaproteobacteria bacterium]|nr:glycosyltransferase family 9 protein [Gammaproteobacteria bacterium]